MSAAVVHLTVEQGADFDEAFQFLDASDAPLDFNGCTARMQLRQRIESDAVIAELTTENGRLRFDQATGTLALHLDASVTAAIQSGAVYDLEIVFPSGSVQRVLKGAVKLDPEVTR